MLHYGVKRVQQAFPAREEGAGRGSELAIDHRSGETDPIGVAGLTLPRRRELDVMDGIERARDEPADRIEAAVEPGMKVGAPRLIVAVINLVLHHLSPLLSVAGGRAGEVPPATGKR